MARTFAASCRTWRRNYLALTDGSVEILARGPAEALDQLARRCVSGPPAARVEKVEARDSDEAVPDGFEQRPTA